MIDDSIEPATVNKPDTKQVDGVIFSKPINGLHTDFFINSYTDRYFIIITQTGSIGTLLSVEKDTTQVEKEVAEVYTIKVLLGKDEEDVHIAARFLAGQLDLPKPILFAFCVKDLGINVLKSILQTLKEHLN
ncbi:proteasome assembly chaperone 3-like [Cloeon dipterum]|uniref:proteasome assembly chaperone 3-like n=1 Tax=Cloeon dipterum TaxID=197152 RepID=UPI00322081CA